MEYPNISLLVFKNENKKEDKHPDYHVRVKIGESFEEIGAGWVKTSGKGTKFISLSIKQAPLRKVLNEYNTTSDGRPMAFPTKEEEWL